MKSLSLLIILTCMLCSQRVRAEIYTCKDAAGHTLTSDRPIPECADRAMFVRQSPTQKQKEIPRPRTAEERRKADAEAEKQKLDELQEEQRKREELYLLANFKSENDIELARQRSVAIVKEKIQVGNEQVKAIDRILTELQSEQQEAAKKSPAENAELQRRANQLALSIKNTRIANEKYEAEQIRINAQFDDILKRYRDIVLKRKKI